MSNALTPLLNLIAQKHLEIDTLETRHSDGLDFHEVAVWTLRDALEAAYKIGLEAGLAQPRHSHGPACDFEA